jgi:hypothetical protein
MHPLFRAKLSVALAPALAIALLSAPIPARAGEGTWEGIRSEDGIRVYKKEVPGSPFVAFRGEGDVSAPILKVAAVLVDVPHEQEWLDSIVEAKIVRKVTDSEYIVYSHLGTPVTMSDRDFVTDTTIAVDSANQTVAVRMRSVDDPAAPQTKYVRAVLTESSFVLTSIDGGTRTHVVAEIHCDPKGSIASWIVNLFQRGWGYNTIEALRKQVKKPGVPVPALLEERLARS